MNKDLISIFFLIILFVIVVYIAFQYFLTLYKNKTVIKRSSPIKKGPAKAPCPVCNSVLYGGETLFTTVYKTSSDKEQVCVIHGCPHCYPVAEKGVKRICPVCHKEIPQKGHIDAYLFKRPGKKSHVHITGCTECGIRRR